MLTMLTHAAAGPFLSHPLARHGTSWPRLAGRRYGTHHVPRERQPDPQSAEADCLLCRGQLPFLSARPSPPPLIALPELFQLYITSRWVTRFPSGPTPSTIPPAWPTVQWCDVERCVRKLDSSTNESHFALPLFLSVGFPSLSWRDRDPHMTYHVFWQLEIFPSWPEIAVQRFGETGGPSDPALALSTTELDWLERGLVTASFYHPCAVPRLHELRQGRARRARKFGLLSLWPPARAMLIPFMLSPVSGEQALPLRLTPARPTRSLSRNSGLRTITRRLLPSLHRTTKIRHFLLMLRRRPSRRTRSVSLRCSEPLRVQRPRLLLLLLLPLRCIRMRPEAGLRGTRERIWRMTAARDDAPTPMAGGRRRRTGTRKRSDMDR